MEKNDDKTRAGERGYVDAEFTKPVPVPFRCACGKDACYGKDGVWACSTCHQEDWLTGQACQIKDEDCEACQ